MIIQDEQNLCLEKVVLKNIKTNTFLRIPIRRKRKFLLKEKEINLKPKLMSPGILFKRILKASIKKN